MTGHDRERLSAYLDGELPDAERGQVAAHLEACPECAEWLAAVAASDEAARALPVEAPPGYFDALPRRVRARLAARPAARRLPVWTWAAAAALLLLVVTPLTLRQRPLDVPAAPVTTAPSGPASAAKAGTPPLAQARASVPEAAAPRPAGPHADADAEPQKRATGFAQQPKREGERRSDERTAGADAPPPPAPLQAAEDAPRELREEQTAALADAPAAPAVGGLTAPMRQQDARSNEKDQKAPAEFAESVARDAVTARSRVESPAPAAAAPAKLSDAASEWQRLEAIQPRTQAEWRALREEWRRFVARAPEGSRADAARLRQIEVARAAFRASGDPADEAVFRADAAAYLDRDEAPQKDRVRRLLADPDSP